MSKKIKMSYIGHAKRYSANIRNAKEGIEVSGVSADGSWKYARADEIVSTLLCTFLRPYSRINPDTRDGKKLLAIQIKEDIENKLEEIERLKMALQMCKRKKAIRTDKETF